MPVGQINNPQMKDILDSEFQRGSDPSFLARIALSKYLNLPGLRGFWGPSNYVAGVGGVLQPSDVSGNGFRFAFNPDNGLYHIDTGFSSYELDGTRCLTNSTAGPYDITMTEAFNSNVGIALGCWIKPTRLGAYGFDQGIMGRWNANSNRRAYLLRTEVFLTHTVFFLLSDNGTRYWAFKGEELVLNKWNFVAATYTPVAYGGEGIGARIWINDQYNYEFTPFYTVPGFGIPALPPSIHVSVADLQVGTYINAAGANDYMQAEFTNWWICGNYVSEADIWNLYETTKYLFGYRNEKGTS